MIEGGQATHWMSFMRALTHFESHPKSPCPNDVTSVIKLQYKNLEGCKCSLDSTFFKLNIIIFYVYVSLPTCMSIYHGSDWCIQRPEEISFLGTGVVDCYEKLCGCWELWSSGRSAGALNHCPALQPPPSKSQHLTVAHFNLGLVLYGLPLF